MMIKRKTREVPGLNMTSMPDLIFTVLFFFMIVTHMRSVPLKVKYEVPAGTELTKLNRKSAVTYIYIGKPVVGSEKDGERIQINDKFVSLNEVASYILVEKEAMIPEDQERMTVSIKADKSTSMGVITDVKQELRKANANVINYSALQRGDERKSKK